MPSIRISELCSKVCSGGTPKSTISSYYGGNIPWLNTKEVNFCNIYDTEKKITEAGLENSSAKWIDKNSIIVAMYGATAGKCAIAKIPLTTNQACCNLTIDENIADYKYVFYALTNDYVRLSSLANGGAQQNLNAQQIKNFEIPYRELKEQRKIVSILSSLDNKIECNRKICENLEQQAQNLFKSWFVDFEPFKNKDENQPQNWELVSLSQLMKYAGGSQPPASEFIDNYKEGYVRFVQIRDYVNNNHITYIPISNKNRLCSPKDIMIARYGASLGRICYGLSGAYNVALAKVLPVKNYYREYLRCYLSSYEFYNGINMKGNRAAQAGFNQSDISSFKVWIPKDETIFQKFENICSELLEQRLILRHESERLSQLRDTLLPKLMSGELQLED